jgi:hypothetical protein
MKEQVKDYLLKAGIMWLFVTTAFAIPASCVKAVHAFYKQVIIK